MNEVRLTPTNDSIRVEMISARFWPLKSYRNRESVCDSRITTRYNMGE